MSWFLKMCDSNMHGDRIKMLVCLQHYLLLALHKTDGGKTVKKVGQRMGTMVWMYVRHK
jgi:hypothetical protein